MKNIEIDDELYLHIVSNTQSIGESASSILRRLLNLASLTQPASLNSVTVNNDEVIATSQATSPKALPIPLSDDVAPDISDQQTKKVTSSESIFNFINREELAMQRGAVGRFLLILAALYRAHAHCFNVVTSITPRAAKGKQSRLYFAASEEALATSGSSTKPKQIPGCPFWVITNSNTTRKKLMLTKVATSLGYNESDVEKIRELL